MPFWRALFYWVWFIPLWNKLRADAMLITHAPKMVKSRLAWPLGWFLFFVCVITQFLSDIDESWILTSLLIAITIMPMVIVINTIKGNLDSSYVSNSRWLIRHTILTVLFAPIFVYIPLQYCYLIPTVSVVSGDKYGLKIFSL